jgi:hypothetical protein
VPSRITTSCKAHSADDAPPESNMPMSLHLPPLLERQVKDAAKRLGKTPSQFNVDAVRQALGREDSWESMQRLIAEEHAGAYGAPLLAEHLREQPYRSVKSRQVLLSRLRAKHGVGT